MTASSTLKIPPNTTHTHAVLSKMGSNPTALQLVAANCQLLMVHAGWIEALEEAAKPEWITNGENEERKRVEKSKLELDFERHWPSEIKHFPTFDERQATSAEKQFWSPNIKRRTLFEGSVFLNFSKVSFRSIGTRPQ